MALQAGVGEARRLTAFGAGGSESYLRSHLLRDARLRQFRENMTHTLEISLRIPSLRIRGREGTEGTETIANGDVRFIKHVDLDKVPKPGDVLTMVVDSGGSFQCEVIRSDWHHEKNMFVIACRYSKRSISEPEYRALLDASDWQMKALL
jgi:hypothetical protein